MEFYMGLYHGPYKSPLMGSRNTRALDAPGFRKAFLEPQDVLRAIDVEDSPDYTALETQPPISACQQSPGNN